MEELIYVDRRNSNCNKWDGQTAMFGEEGLNAMWVADMDFKIPQCVQKALHEYVDFGAIGYYRIPDGYYDAFINWEKKHFDFEVKREWLRFAPGVVAAFNWMIQMLTKKGDAVIVMTPVYYPFLQAVTNNERKLITSDLVNENGNYTIDFNDFEKKIVDNDVKTFILCSPHNPVGRVWRKEELKEMFKICHRHHVYVISDEIHQDFVFGDKKQTPSYLMTEHIIKLCKHLKEKGMKHVYIYHDMLYQEFDIINEKLKERFISEGIYDVVVIDWWSYEDPVHLFYNKADGVNNIFHSVIKPDTGYYHWAIPTENNENIRACAMLAKKLSFEGIESYSSMEYCYDKNYLTLADVSWNDNEIEKIDEFNERYAGKYYPEKAVQAAEIFNGLHNIMKDETRESYINRACYKLEYYFYGYRNKQTGLPKDFPGGVYKLIAENEKEYTHYLKFLKENAAPAVEFFVNSGNVSLINSIWLLTSKHYYALSDEYLTIYSLYKDYNSDKCDAAKVINELERLISQREKLMLLAEEVRIPPNRSTYLRNMSVFRQYMLDLRDYFKKTLEIGKKPKLDVMDLSYAMSSKFEFLR